MQQGIVEKIRENRSIPLIGVAGGTSPTPGYTQDVGMQTGYELRRYVETRDGTIFTGGVGGVGIDVYLGVVKFCVDKLKRRMPLIRNGSMPEDKFFVLAPRYIYYAGKSGLFHRTESRRIDYDIPTSYEVLGRLTPRGYLDVFRAGMDMDERRKYLASAADALVIINGGGGTLDEAINALKASKPVISLNSGGVTRLLEKAKTQNNPSLLQPSGEEGMYVAGGTGELDLSLLHIADNTNEIIRYLYKIF